jgi:dsRNA-specific ribonuclease
MNSKLRRKSVLEDAWLGDAVLALFARERILALGQGIDNEKAIRMTSNRFLSILGDASEVEARIGALYKEKGLDTAFSFIESEIEPFFLKGELKRKA